MICKAIISFLLLLSMIGCMARIPGGPPRPAGDYAFRETGMPSLADDGERESLEKAVNRSLEYLAKRTPRGNPSGGFPVSAGPAFSRERILRSLTLFREIAAGVSGPGEWERRVAENFTLWELRP